jgi:uncharacterized protein (DUF2147 family)
MKQELQTILVALLLSPSPAPAQEAQQDGIWRDPQNSVHVRIHPCGKGRCGVVVWANDKAKAESLRGGTPNLIGVNLLRDFYQVKANVWKGMAFVPAHNRTLASTITIEDQDTAIARGCLFGNHICKSQIWTRVR